MIFPQPSICVPDFPAGKIQTHRVAGRQVASNNATRYAEPPWFGRCNCLALWRLMGNNGGKQCYRFNNGWLNDGFLGSTPSEWRNTLYVFYNNSTGEGWDLSISKSRCVNQRGQGLLGDFGEKPTAIRWKNISRCVAAWTHPKISGWWLGVWTPRKNDGLRQLGWWKQPKISGKMQNGWQPNHQADIQKGKRLWSSTFDFSGQGGQGLPHARAWTNGDTLQRLLPAWIQWKPHGWHTPCVAEDSWRKPWRSQRGWTPPGESRARPTHAQSTMPFISQIWTSLVRTVGACCGGYMDSLICLMSLQSNF